MLNKTRNAEFVLKFDIDITRCCYGLTLNSALKEDASLTTDWKYSLLGRVNGNELSIVKTKGANKLSFKVGEKFTSEGLIASLRG